MTTTATEEPIEVGAETATPVAEEPSEPRPSLTLGELSALVAVLAIGSIGSVSLILAQIGRHDGLLSVVLGTVLAALLALATVALGGRPSLSIDKVEIGLLAGTVLVAGFMFLPGFPYAYGDKDPGVYVAHAFAIARDGDVAITDEIEEHGLDASTGSATNFPGVWPAYDDAEAVTSQFYHYTSALMATADDLAGRRGVFNLSPLLAVLSVTAIVLAARRAAGTPVAAIAALLLVTSMIQVWQAKYPSTEVPAQLFLAGALLAAVLAVGRGWAGGAFIAGLLVGVEFLTRPDGFLYILIAVGVAALVIAVGRADRRLVALGLGLAITVPGALWNAYQLRHSYSETNGIPGPATLGLAAVGLLIGGMVVHAALRWRDLDLLGLLGRWQRWLGAVATVLFGLVLVVLWNRNTLFGQSYIYNPFTGESDPNLNEFNLRWLTLFVSLPGFAIMWLGFGVVALQRAKLSLYLLLLPGVALLPLYLWNAKVSPRMMWWVRRYVPAVLPAILLLIAIALGWALWHRSRVLKIAGAAALIGLVGFFGAQSGPLRGHREMGGSWDMAAAVVAPADDQASVFVFARPSAGDVFDPARNLPIDVWWIYGQTAAWLPEDYDMSTIQAYRAAFPDRPLFLVAHGDLPEGLPDGRFEIAGVMSAELIHWEEWPWGTPAPGEPAHRPDTQLRTPESLAVWRLVD